VIRRRSPSWKVTSWRNGTTQCQEGQTETIEKPLTHQTIAHMIGASRETVSRTVRDFQNQGLIRVERRRISVANRPALKQLAQTRM
jgi:CRP/FNR family cyclic AMP-dependent transcriptional regulator